jgi:Uma2 family endonuclease
VVVADNFEHPEFLRVYTALLKGKDKLCGYNLLLVNGKVIVRERPGGPHETLSRRINRVFESYLNYEVLTSGGSTRFQYGANSSLEPDECFVNRHIPPTNVITDARGEAFPSIVIEINSSEGYASADETAQVYLNNPATRVVISIKLVLSRSQNPEIRGKITQMYFILYRAGDRQPGAIRVNPIQVVSFGASAETSSMNAILRHTQVDPVNFTGVGRTTDVIHNNTANAPLFQVIIDAQDIWYNVPNDAVPDIPRSNINVDLFEVLAFLQATKRSL